MELPFRDFLKETPVSDETFELFLAQYRYDKTPLNARIERAEQGEDFPRTDLYRESLAWLDEYLGPVEGPARSTPPARWSP